MRITLALLLGLLATGCGENLSDWTGGSAYYRRCMREAAQGGAFNRLHGDDKLSHLFIGVHDTEVSIKCARVAREGMPPAEGPHE